MLCFKDITFCEAECGNTNCDRRLTDEVQQQAIKWWGNEQAPIAVSDFSGDCDKFEMINQ